MTALLPHETNNEPLYIGQQCSEQVAAKLYIVCNSLLALVTYVVLLLPICAGYIFSLAASH